MGSLIGNMNQLADVGLSVVQNVTVLTATIVIGVIVGIFGLKLARIWSAFVGFMVGIGIGAAIVALADLSGIAMVGALLGAAIVFAVLFCIFYKVGMFFFVWLITTGLFLGIVQKQSLVFIIIGAVLGLVIALLTLKFFDAIVIIATSLNGAISAGGAAAALLKLTNVLPALIGIPVVLFALFMFIQFLMRSRQVGKKQKEKANEHKKKSSRENDVEAARSLLDGDFDDDDDEDYDFGEDAYNPDDGEYYDDDDEDYYYDDDYDEDEDDYNDDYDEDDDELDDDFTIV